MQRVRSGPPSLPPPPSPSLPPSLPCAGKGTATGDRSYGHASPCTPRPPVVDGNKYADRSVKSPRDGGGRTSEARQASSPPPPPSSPRGLLPPLASLPDARNPRQVAFQGSRGVTLSFNYWVGQALSNQVWFFSCARRLIGHNCFVPVVRLGTTCIVLYVPLSLRGWYIHYHKCSQHPIGS